MKSDSNLLLGAALAQLPPELVRTLTFSTYRGFPQRSRSALTFASAVFSEVHPLADAYSLYVPLGLTLQGQPPTRPGERDFSARSIRLASENVQYRRSSPAHYPVGLTSLTRFDEWLRMHTTAQRPLAELSEADCLALLMLPSDTHWINHSGVLNRLIIEIDRSNDEHRLLPSITTQDQRRTLLKVIHDAIIADLTTDPTRARQLASVALRAGDTESELAHVLEKPLTLLLHRYLPEQPVDTDLAVFLSELAAHVSEATLVEWADTSSSHPALLATWESTASLIASRTWSTDGWATAHALAAVATASKYSAQSTEIVVERIRSGSIDAGTIANVLSTTDSQSQAIYLKIVSNAVTDPRIKRRRLASIKRCNAMPATIRELTPTRPRLTRKTIREAALPRPAESTCDGATATSSPLDPPTDRLETNSPPPSPRDNFAPAEKPYQPHSHQATRRTVLSRLLLRLVVASRLSGRYMKKRLRRFWPLILVGTAIAVSAVTERLWQ